jgi:hypothetical protein
MDLAVAPIPVGGRHRVLEREAALRDSRPRYRINSGMGCLAPAESAEHRGRSGWFGSACWKKYPLLENFGWRSG